MTMEPEQKESMSSQAKEILDTSHLHKGLFKQQFRDAIVNFEEQLGAVEGAQKGDSCPLDHIFVDGAYVRTIKIPADIVMTSKIHKITHPYFIMKGEVDVLTEHGMQRIKAPYMGITKAGTKRVLRTYTEVIWTTVHVTNETDIDKIEEQIIAKSYDEIKEDEL